jgi:protein-disulfide isomerase/uncharacterized membrane protein
MVFKNLNKFVLGGIGLALVGVFLSFVLVLEYYGSAGTLGQGLCSVVGSGDSCEKVASSSYSAIRGIPLLGDIPVALFGLGFYGAMVFGFYKLNQSKEETDFRETLDLLFYFSILAIVIDLLLFLISIFLIGTVCGLCFLTYIVSISLFGIIFFLRKNSKDNELISIVPNLKKNLINYTIAFLAFFSLGQAIGKSTSAQVSIGSEDGTGSYSSRIQAYETRPNLEIDTKGSSTAGSPSAPVTIIKFADFNCGHCMHTSHLLNEMLTEFDGLVKVVYMNFPLDGACNRLVQGQRPGSSSCVAASAVLCADKQGKFKPFYDGLYKDTELGVMHTTTSVLNLAAKINIKMPEFRSCMGSGLPSLQLEKEVNQAEKLNIQSTPSLYINGKALEPGSPDPEFLRSLLKHLIKKA